MAAWVAYNGLQDTARQLQGMTIYNVAKDGKALQKRYLKREADADEVMSYFYSVYRLHTSNVLGGNQRTRVPSAADESLHHKASRVNSTTWAHLLWWCLAEPANATRINDDIAIFLNNVIGVI